MNIKTHIYTSTLLGGVAYGIQGSVTTAITATLSGVFIDLDHLIDFFIFAKEKFSITNFFSWCNDARWDKISLLLHSYELYGLLFVTNFFYDSDVLSGILIGAGVHLFLDQVGNGQVHKISPLFYFFTFRFCSGFKKEKLLRSDL